MQRILLALCPIENSEARHRQRGPEMEQADLAHHIEPLPAAGRVHCATQWHEIEKPNERGDGEQDAEQ